MSRGRFLLAALLCLVPSVAGAGRSDAGPAAGRAPDPRDALFLQRALRIGRTVAARHTSPEGLLAYEHRPGATPEQLSADALKKADVAIWSGCYAASLACRYAVTKEPEALVEVKRLAAGLDLLSAATGVVGCISRSVGRALPGEDPGEKVVSSPLGGGLAYRNDPSRDSLSGVVLGWACLHRFVDDPEVKAVAARNIGAIARRLYEGKMKLRDADGKVTHFGDLDPDIVLGLFSNAEYAAIGMAALAAGMAADGGKDLHDAYKKMSKKGWAGAVDDTYTWMKTPLTDPSNLNMIHLAILTLVLDGEGDAKEAAKHAFHDLRQKTVGWMNGALLSTYLLAGRDDDRKRVVSELRQTLENMPADEVEWVGTTKLPSETPVPPALRPISVWSWKASSFVAEYGRENAKKSPDRTFTRADFLFAYWLARAAGELDPAGGAGR